MCHTGLLEVKRRDFKCKIAFKPHKKREGKKKEMYPVKPPDGNLHQEEGQDEARGFWQCVPTVAPRGVSAHVSVSGTNISGEPRL